MLRKKRDDDKVLIVDASKHFIKDGKNNKRTIKSRSGMIIRMDDTDGGEKLEISDKASKNSSTVPIRFSQRIF